MAILKCKMCGGDIQATDEAYGTCESCGSTSTLPKTSDDRKANLFNRANHYRRQNEFDKAMQAYESILNEDNADAEAHWGVVLSRYGIEYVEDSKTGQRIPTCRRLQSESILKDVDYVETLKYAPNEYARSLYEGEAKKIAEIQKGILAISNREKPYDVFICYKETTDGGSRTKDSTIAQDIYYQLTKEGYRVFFSKITLEDKPGQQYEPYIFSALNSAKIMVVIGTRVEYFEAVWVKNEWSRFYALTKENPSRLLIPCYKGIDPYDLPSELSALQGFDMAKVGFMHDLTHTVKKVLDRAKESVSVVGEVPKYIPERFTDKFINDEIGRYEKEIATCVNERERLEGEIYSARNEENQIKMQQQQAMSNYHARGQFGFADSFENSFFKQRLNSVWDRINDTQGNKQRYSEIEANAKTKIRELETFRNLTPAQRMEKHYQSLLDKKKQVSNDEEMLELSQQFLLEMGGYKNSKELGEECLNTVAEKKRNSLYNTLLAGKKKAQTPDDFKKFAKGFRDMKGYKDTESLAEECERIALEKQYSDLCYMKSRAKTEEDYRTLVNEFREMGNYKEAQVLANECDSTAQQILDFKKNDYSKLLEDKKRAEATPDNSDASIFHNLAARFRKLDGYEKANALAKECEELAFQKDERRIAEEKAREEQQRLEERKRQADKWASQGLCHYCGGEFGGVFTKKCKACGQKK